MNHYDKRNFPLLAASPIAYLDNAATRVCDEAREAVRAFIHAGSSDEIIFTRNTTESLNLVAYSYGLSTLKTGDEIVVSIMEHHSNLLPWQMVCRQTGAQLRFLECEANGCIDLNKAASIIGARTRLVAVTQVSNVLGASIPFVRSPIWRIARALCSSLTARRAPPHMPVDVRALGADFFAFSGHKVYGPMGVGVLYGRRELLEVMPPFLTGGEMIESVRRESAVFAELPYKFEAGTCNAAGAAGLHAALDYVSGLGFEAMRARETALVRRAMDGMAALPSVHVLGSDKPEEHTGIVTFVVDGVHPHDVSEILASDGVAVRAGHHCAQPLLEFLGHRSTVRASFAFYNTENDVDRLLDSLSSIRERMGYGK